MDTATRRAEKTARETRSHKNDLGRKGAGKVAAHRADRRLGRAICRAARAAE